MLNLKNLIVKRQKWVA